MNAFQVGTPQRCGLELGSGPALIGDGRIGLQDQCKFFSVSRFLECPAFPARGSKFRRSAVPRFHSFTAGRASHPSRTVGHGRVGRDAAECPSVALLASPTPAHGLPGVAGWGAW